MKRFAFNLLMIVVLAALCYGGYYCIKSLTDPKRYVVNDNVTLGDLHRVDSSAINIDASTSGTADSTSSATTSDTAPASDATTPPPSPSSALSSALQAIAAKKVVLKQGAANTAVGTVQQFMNLYFQKNVKIDNDFGKALTADVKKFQSQNKISATGQVGAQTLQQMVAWLANR